MAEHRTELREQSESLRARGEELRQRYQRAIESTRAARRGGHPLSGAAMRLLSISATELQEVLSKAAQIMTEALRCDKVDVFLHCEDSDSLVAQGISDTSLDRWEQALGLDRLPLASPSPIRVVFQSGLSHLDGHVDADPLDHPDFSKRLGVRSSMMCAIEIAGERRGVLMACSTKTEAFDARDLRFFEAAGRWVGLVAERADRAERAESAPEPPRQPYAIAQHPLTERQEEIALLIADGLTNAEIAEQLVLTPGTVANHIAHIMNRLNVRNRAQIATWAVRHLGRLMAVSHSPVDGLTAS